MIIHGESIEELRKLPENSIDAVVTDPPYGLSNTDPGHVMEAITQWVKGNREYVPPVKGGGFMGKDWDSFVPPPALWDECLRVLKPGGYLLSFAGSRTVDLMTLGIRLAGFDLRDSIAWLYGSGFPKSQDVSKFIDKTLGAEREVLGQRDVGPDLRGDNYGRNDGERMMADVTSGPVTAEAQKWDGWGTALKPAIEPIVMARKPFKGTVAANVLEHGTGALNIDASRIGDGTENRSRDDEATQNKRYTDNGVTNFAATPGPRGGSPAGRFPANVILDESQAAALDEQSGTLKSGILAAHHNRRPKRTTGIYSDMDAAQGERGYGDSGGASRFFYCAKAPTSERPKVDGIAHATVKPLTLMKYLVKLVTPPGGTVLDPFAGSGTTVEACILEGFRYVAIEREAEYLPLIDARMDRAVETLAADLL